MELTQHQPGIFVLSLTDAENRFNPTFMANVHAALDQVDRYTYMRVSISPGGELTPHVPDTTALRS